MVKPIRAFAAQNPGQLLWTAEPINLRPPRRLWCPAVASDFVSWRVENPWADSIEAVLFQADREGDAPEIGTPFAESHAHVPFRHLGGPPGVDRRTLQPLYEARGLVDDDGVGSGLAFALAVRRYQIALRAAARLLADQPAWTVKADADDGIMSVVLASVHGRHVALSARPIGLVGTSLATELGVSVLVEGRSDQFQYNAFLDEERRKGET